MKLSFTLFLKYLGEWEPNQGFERGWARSWEEEEGTDWSEQNCR